MRQVIIAARISDAIDGIDLSGMPARIEGSLLVAGGPAPAGPEAGRVRNLLEIAGPTRR